MIDVFRRKRVLGDRGFSLIEAMAAVGLSGVVITACLFLSGESSKQVGKRVQGSKAFLSLQSISEQLLVSNGSAGDLSEGSHGPVYYDVNGRVVANGPIAVSWTVTINDPSPNILRVKTNASWGGLNSGNESADLIVYRSVPLRASTSTIERVPLPSPSPFPTPPPNIGWGITNGACNNGLRSRTAQCQDLNTGWPIDESNCTPPKPTYTDGACVTTYSWSPGDWEASCTNGSHTRPIYCNSSNWDYVDDSNCDPAIKPSNTEACASCYPFCQ